MTTVVQKYGGSSVSTPEKIKSVAQRIVDTARQGYSVVVVVSAMGNTTNQLLDLAQQISPHPQRRELDMLLTVGERISMSLLSMAIQDLGHPAVSFTGSQSGIITTNTHTNARIIKVRPHRILKALDQHQIVIVAGFQGVSEQLEITSLGRGGSDTTAVALAAALNASYAEICSDVDGVYSADPRLVSDAQHIAHLSYEEMQSLADSGAKVLNAEAVEWAKRNQIEIRCVSTHDSSQKGTRIHSHLPSTLESGQRHSHPHISAITHHPDLYYIYRSSPLDLEMSAAFGELGLNETSILSTPQSWHAWIPKQNLHQNTHFQHFLTRFDLSLDEQKWTTVSMIGRRLLGIQVDDPSYTPSLLESELTDTYSKSWIIDRAERFLKMKSISIAFREYTAGYLRWTLPESSAAEVVRGFHELFIHPPTNLKGD